MERFFRQKCFAVLLILCAAFNVFAEEKIEEHDNSIVSIFVQPALSFLSFEQREYFQDAIDTIYTEFKENSYTAADSQNVAKQDFQKVNFCFPITGGLQVQIAQDQFISAGVGFIYDNESVVLADKNNRSHNYSYTIQGVPAFLEYRFGIPTNFMTLSDGSLFSVAFRWYWTLPGTEIYTTWGSMKAKNSPYGAGFGLSVGYLLASWKNITVFGDIGYSTIKVESRKSFADIVPDGPTEKAKWNIGGIQIQIRIGFGAWNKPKPIEEDEDGGIAIEESTEGQTVEADTSKNDKPSIKDSAEGSTSEAKSVEESPAEQAPAEGTP